MTTKERFSQDATELAAFAKAISHPARIEILKELAKKRECVCGDLVLNLPLSQSTVSQHLKALKDAGLIKGAIDGTKSRYCIDWRNFEKLHNGVGGWTTKLMGLKNNNNC